MRLAETKRQYVLNELYSSTLGPPVGNPFADQFLVNCFGSLSAGGTGTTDLTFIGNQIVDPLVALKLTVAVNWGALTGAGNFIPTVRVDAYLIAINDQLSATTPRLTTLGEDENFFVRHPTNDLRWMLNSQSVTVIKRRKVMLAPRGLNSFLNYQAYESRVIKMSKRLRGVKTFEQSNTALGVENTSLFLKGFNYYWLVVYQANVNVATAVVNNPIRISGDRFLYFKDL